MYKPLDPALNYGFATFALILPFIIQAISPLTVSAAQPYATVVVTAGQWQPQHQALGHLQAWRKETLTAPFELSIKDLSVTPGEVVEQGQRLATVTAPDLNGLLESLTAADRHVTLAEQYAQITQRLLGQKLASQDNRLQAEIALNEARSKLDGTWQAVNDALLALGQETDRADFMARLRHTARERIAEDLALIRAPFAASVAQSYTAAGVHVSRGAALFLLADTTRMDVAVEVPPEERGLWQRGSARIALPSGQIRPLGLMAVEPSLDAQTGLAVVRYRVDNPEGRLLDGQWLQVHLAGALQSVLWVPEAAVVSRDGQTFCIVQRGNAYDPVKVRVGRSEQGRIPILAGLRKGERVVTQGAYELLYRDLTTLMKPTD